jgi:hypothetical protein
LNDKFELIAAGGRIADRNQRARAPNTIRGLPPAAMKVVSMIQRLSALTALVLFSAPALAEEPLKREAAEAALRRAVQFFRTEVSIEGGYLWRYSPDLEHREGEGQAGKTTAWVQPPGTPSIGMAFLEAYRRTRDDYLLDAARETAYALVKGQLVSGGWDYRIEFDAKDRQRYAYRVDHADGQVEKLRNTSTLDDNTTQSALRFLIEIDSALGFKDEKIHEAAEYGLKQLMAVQFPNGAWPQRFEAPPDPDKHPILKANYPDEWPREWPSEDYRGYYTFNDNALADVIALLFDAADIYDDERYSEAARRGGDFILLAQMPEPQPAWAQQYNLQMQPAWARKFEPPSITGGESQGVLRTLLEVYRRTRDPRYLAPISPALDYLKKSQLADGRLARFYELKSNRPLYFTRQYELTYDDGDLPTHYAFKVSSRLEAFEESLRFITADPRGERRRTDTPRLTDGLQKQAAEIVAQLDSRGAWVEPGRLSSAGAEDVDKIIDTRTFIENVETLSRFIQASRS